jgi:hypothetical protein
MFEIINEGNSTIKFIFIEPFTTEDMKKVLALILKVLEKQKPIAIYVDARKANRPPSSAASMLLQWMRENKEIFKKYLICTAVVFSNSNTNILIKNLLMGVFKIQKPAAPNCLFTDYEKCVKWVKNKVEEHKVGENIKENLSETQNI